MFGLVKLPTQRETATDAGSRLQSACKALMTLDGRYFGGRVVRASFFPEHKFHARNFDDDSGDNDDD